MSAESKIYDALHASSTLAGLVSDRVYPGQLPQGKPLPGVVYIRMDTEYIMTIHDSTPRGSDAAMEIWGIAETFTLAEQVGDAIYAALGVAKIKPTGRRSEIDPATESNACVITCSVYA